MIALQSKFTRNIKGRNKPMVHEKRLCGQSRSVRQLDRIAVVCLTHLRCG
jgi:hypothetical protein